MKSEIENLRTYKILHARYCHVWWEVDGESYFGRVDHDHALLSAARVVKRDLDNPHPTSKPIKLHAPKNKAMLDAVVHQLREQSLIEKATTELKERLLSEAVRNHEHAVCSAVLSFAEQVRTTLVAIAAGVPSATDAAIDLSRQIESRIPEMPSEEKIFLCCLT